MLRLLAFLCLLYLPALSGCTGDLRGSKHTATENGDAAHAVIPYAGSWEYRYGDSPRARDGSFLYSLPRHEDGSWRHARSPYLPEGRGNNGYLWLRTRLTGPPLADATLYLQSVNQSFQAFLDGKLIAEYGHMDGEKAQRFQGEPRAYLQLLQPPTTAHPTPDLGGYVGRTLTLRVYSPHRYIGIFGEVLLGSQATLISDQVRRGTSAFIVGVLLCTLGVLALCLFLLRYTEHVYFYYGAFTMSAGLHILARTSLRELVFDAPALWSYFEVMCLPLVAVFLCAFVWKTLGSGPLRIMPRLSLTYLSFFVAATVLVACGVVNLWQVLLPVQLLILSGVVALVTTVLLAAWRGDTNARILSGGITFCSVCAVLDIMAAMNLVGGSQHIISHYGSAGLVLSLGIILGRRFVGYTLMTDRAARLEQESAMQKQRLREQTELLDAAARMAKGDLYSNITVPPGSELSPLAVALDSMRQDLRRKIFQLEESNGEIRGLNEELRRQIEQRSRRLMETVARGFGPNPGTNLANAVAPGKRLGDHYHVLSTLGRGAMGAVYEVERLTDHRHFAAKVLTEAREKMSLLRFAREAQILCRLDHRNLISIVDIDVTDGGVVFLVMELVRGSTLKLQRERYRELGFVVEVLSQITAGLMAIHKSGIVHRDLKPANVLLTEDENHKLIVKLADFGISMLAEEELSVRSAKVAKLHPSEVYGDPELDQTSEKHPEADYAEFCITVGSPQSLKASEHASEYESDEHDSMTATWMPRERANAAMAAALEPPLDTNPSYDQHYSDEALSSDDQLTATGVLVGTPMYMAPELADGSHGARPPADIFSLGVIAFELLTGDMPFAKPMIWASLRNEWTELPKVGERRPDLPTRLTEILDRCLARDPRQRPTAEELNEVLSLMPVEPAHSIAAA